MHSISNKILVVLEGAKSEGEAIEALRKRYKLPDTIVSSIYGGEVYQLYKTLAEDDDIDTFNLLKERPDNKELLKEYKRNDFAEIYLFFDYDGHSSMAADEKLIELMEFFNEETDKGKLYISYPMVEALKDISCYEGFKERMVPCKTNIKYKEKVASEGLAHLRNYARIGEEEWTKVVEAHLKKQNYIVNECYQMATERIEPIELFKKQQTNYIARKVPQVAVVSAFPSFLLDYFGVENFIP